MSVKASYPLKKSGFTIVELLIVVVVIAILAAISIVAYTGIQARAYDSKMINGLNQIENALRLYSIDYGSTIVGGWGSTAVATGSPCIDGADGWFASGTYACAAEDTLVARNFLPVGLTASLPPNRYYGAPSNGQLSVMLYICNPNGITPGRFALYWTLRNPSATDSANINSIITTCGQTTNVRDSWGMRAAKIIQL